MSVDPVYGTVACYQYIFNSDVHTETHREKDKLLDMVASVFCSDLNMSFELSLEPHFNSNSVRSFDSFFSSAGRLSQHVNE